MSLKSTEEALKVIPDLFDINLNVDKDGNVLFRKLTSLIDFDEGFIYFLNPESLQLKYSYKKHKNYKLEEAYQFDNSLKDKLYSKTGEILQQNSEFIETVGLSKLNKKSWIISKISIKSTVFGVILLAKKERNYYTKTDLEILNSASCILSYVLKDMELSNVFKIQLKALKDGIIEKNE